MTASTLRHECSTTLGMAVALTLLSTTVTAAKPPGDWLSEFGGPSNSRRANGEPLGLNWQEVWRVDHIGGGHVLAKDGVAVFERAQHTQFSGVDIATGNELWTVTAGATNTSYRGGCISADRVFIPMSRNGSGSPPYLTTRVEARDLHTGAYLWTWDSGTDGGGSVLQVSPANAAAGIPERVVFNYVNFSSSNTWLGQRIVVLDPTASDAISAEVAVQAPYGNWRLSWVPLTVMPSSAAPANTLFLHQYGYATPNWFSHSLRAVDLQTLVDPAAPFPSSPPMSGQTLSTAPSSIGFGPLTLGNGNVMGFLYDTGGFLRAYDLVAGAEAWVSPVQTSNHRMSPYVMSASLLLADPSMGTLTAYSQTNGSVLWTKSVGGGTLPANPLSFGGVILEEDVLLLPFDNDDIHPVLSDGTLLPSVWHGPVFEVVATDGMFLVVTTSEVICYRPADDPGTGYCPGDPGVGTPCPCYNDNDGSIPGSGCANGVFASGAQLTASGIASITNDTLVLATTHLEPSNSGLYFQAENDLSPGNVWGDGLQCAGATLIRLGVRISDATGYSDTSGYPYTIAAKAGNISPGDTKYYQCWYRNPLNSPCGSEFNASNGYAITWLP